MLRHYSAQLFRCHATSFRYARQLKLSGCRSDMGIEARGRGRYEIDGNRRAWIFYLSGGNVQLYAIEKLLVRRPKVRASGVGCIISVARGRWTGAEISRPGKSLPNNS